MTTMPRHIQKRCYFCGGCSAVCPENIITVWETKLEIDRERCKECLLCVQLCPAQALVKE